MSAPDNIADTETNRMANSVGRNACNRRSTLQSPLFDARRILRKAGSRIGNKVVISQPRVNDLTRDGVRESNI